MARSAAASTRGAITLLGMGPGLQDLLAQGRGRLADLAGVFPDALDRPAGVAAMAGRHGRTATPVGPMRSGSAVRDCVPRLYAWPHELRKVEFSEKRGQAVAPVLEISRQAARLARAKRGGSQP